MVSFIVRGDMKIFDRGGKINFVDENNVMLGYDNDQCCCEHADWFIADEVTPKILDHQPVDAVDGWVFDPDFFREIDHATSGDAKYNCLDAGGMAVFRIVKGDAEKFIHLFNCHNGYYGHGFSFMNGNTPIQQGGL